MPDTLNVTCPECGTVLIVNRNTGEVLEVRKPLLDKDATTGDRWEDARKRVEESDKRLEEKVAAAKKAQEDKLAKLDALFKDRKKEIEEGGEEIDRPDIFRD